MNFSLRRALALSILGVAASIGSAYAGQATFHLPFNAQWGSLALSAGDYRLTVPEVGAPNSLFFLRGQSAASFRMAGGFQPSDNRGKAYIKLVNIDGEYFVREYISGVNGNAYWFQTPNAAHHEQLAERILTFDENVGTK
jgi:hypothetical protein